MQKRLEASGKAAENEFGGKQQSFQREVDEYKKNMNTMPADQRQTTEQHLQREQQDLQNYQQNAAAQLQHDQGAENSKLYDKISDFVKAYAKEKGYKLVLTFSKVNPTVLYGDPALDVTADVVKGLNDANAKDKK
jgi:outer membrane protein